MHEIPLNTNFTFRLRPEKLPLLRNWQKSFYYFECLWLATARAVGCVCVELWMADVGIWRFAVQASATGAQWYLPSVYHLHTVIPVKRKQISLSFADDGATLFACLFCAERLLRVFGVILLIALDSHNSNSIICGLMAWAFSLRMRSAQC